MHTLDNGTPAAITVKQLRPLDVMMLRTIGPVSEFTSWTQDSFYGHVAIVLDRKMLLEGSIAGARVLSIEERIKAPVITVIDIYRFRPISKLDGRTLLGHARQLYQKFRDIYFPGKALAWNVLISLIRNYAPIGKSNRARLRPALDRLLPNRRSKLNCLDVFSRACTDLFRTYGPLLIVDKRKPLRTTLPALSIPAFFNESRAVLRRAKKSVVKKPTAAQASAQFQFIAGKEMAVLSSLDLARAKRRALLIGQSAKPWTLRHSAVMLSDIETSPSFELVGRLKHWQSL
jgi:hypothetical protein